MDIVDKFSNILSNKLKKDPASARRLLSAGYKLFQWYGKVRPDKRLPYSKRYAADVVMSVILKVLKEPENTAMVSLFVPGEPLCAAGVTPYSVEALSSYMAGTHIEDLFLNIATEQGVPETMCSFHRVFLGAALSHLVPDPPFIIYTNLACDANMITFPYLREKYKVPTFYIEVPYEKCKDSVEYVAGQLREEVRFLEDVRHTRISEESLSAALQNTQASVSYYRQHLEYQKTRNLKGMMTSDMYGVFMSRILSGTEQSKVYSAALLDDIKKEKETKTIKAAWVHMMPFMQPSLRKMLNFSDEIYFTVNDLTYDGFRPVDPAKPYESMAERMVYSCFNGDAAARIENTREMVEKTGADGVVLFNHFGCKTTLGASILLQQSLEKEGIPVLILEGDGCSPSNSPSEQLVTRMEAFIELLESKNTR